MADEHQGRSFTEFILDSPHLDFGDLPGDAPHGSGRPVHQHHVPRLGLPLVQQSDVSCGSEYVCWGAVKN